MPPAAAVPLPATLPMTVRLSVPATLTDEQIDAIADAHRWDTREGRRQMVRAAIAALSAV